MPDHDEEIMGDTKETSGNPDDVRSIRQMREDLERSLLGYQEKGKESDQALLPVCIDVDLFFKLLESSDLYKETLSVRFEEAKKNFKAVAHLEYEPPTIEGVEKLFEDSEEKKQLFWNLDRDVIHLGYDERRYSSEFREAFEKYRKKAKDSVEEAKKGKDRDLIVEKDRVRSEYHNKVARILISDGIVSNEFWGRVLVRAFLVDVEDDHIESARTGDLIRTLRGLPTERSRKKFLTESPFSKMAEVNFSGEDKIKIQETFLKFDPQPRKVPRSKFLS